jgi:exodeoxyribonuclease VIII
MTIEEALKKGIVENLQAEEYHAIEALGSSPLKKFHDCPAKAFEPIDQSVDMALGGAVDDFCLVSPEEFRRHYIIQPDFGDLRKSDIKQKASEFQDMAQVLKLTVLPPYVTTKNIPTMQAISDVRDYLFVEHSLAKMILRTGGQQVSLFWEDDETGIPCKGRLDHLPDPQYRIIVDLKKCARIERFAYQLEELRYFIQAGHYSVGAEKNNLDVNAFAFIAFNFGNPPQCEILMIGDEVDEWGGGEYFTKCKNLARTTVRLIHECREANHFPKYSIPFETQSMAQILGLKSNAPGQLTPFQLGKQAAIPRCLKGLV